MITIDTQLTQESLLPATDQLFELAGKKIKSIHRSWNPERGTPVFTVRGQYTSRGWTEWTQGFQFGCAILHFDATGDEESLALGREATVRLMASHISHIGVHDHGFNNISTYGNLLRLMGEGRIPHHPWENEYYRLALKLSGAVQAARWTEIGPNEGFVYSFNGPHSLFADTIRSMRALAVSHQLGHCLMGEKDRRINLLERLIQHARTTAKYNVFYGEGRDAYDVRGRTAHESIFNLNDGSYRCPSSQQGYSPFSTWTRGLAWILCGYAEQLEYLDTRPDAELEAFGGRKQLENEFLRPALATADFFIENTPTDGIPYWDTGAPGLAFLGDYLHRPAEPFNDHEPVDSSAASIAAQGYLRLGRWLIQKGKTTEGQRYFQAGLTIARRVFSEDYLSLSETHQGLILHSIYHRPNGWDYVPEGCKIPAGESSMWGDYHAMELALLIRRMARHEIYPTFFSQLCTT